MVRELTEIRKSLIVDGIPSSDLILFCPGLHGLGGKLLDRSAYANHGTITGAAWARLPRGIYILNLDGTDDKITFPAHAIYSDLTNLTIETWVQPAAGFTTNYRKIINVSDDGFYLYTDSSSGKVVIYPPGIVSTTPLVAGTIYHIRVTKLGTAVKLYINDVMEGSGTGSIATATRSLNIGADAAGTAQFWKGKIGMMRLNAGVAASLYSRQRHLFGV